MEHRSFRLRVDCVSFVQRRCSPPPDARVVSLGGALTWNFWRKGGYNLSSEDWWAIVRSWYPGVQFELLT